MRTKSYKTALCLIFLLSMVWTAHAEESKVIPGLQGEQYVILRLSQDSVANVEHYTGDDEATLIIKHPAPNTIDMLSAQVGSLMVKVRRKSLIGDELRVGLRLRNAAIQIQVKQLEHPRSLTLGFFSLENQRLPPLEKMLLLLPSSYPEGEPSMILPPRPSTRPCSGLQGIEKTIEAAREGNRLSNKYLKYADQYVKDTVCRDYIHALNAEAILHSGTNVVDAEKWAFAMSEAPQWNNYRESYEYHALVAANVLIDLSLFPEAELLLEKMDQAVTATMMPYVKLGESRFFMKQQKYSEAAVVLERLLKKVRKGAWRYSAYLNSAINYTKLKDREHTRDIVLKAEKTLQADKKDGGALWLIGAEAALALNDYRSAIKLYSRAAKVGGSWDSAFAEMRLGELAAIQQPNLAGLTKVHKHFDHARKNQPDIYFTQIIRFKEELIYDILTNGKVDLRKIEDAFSDAFKQSTQFEIAYTIALIHLEQGESQKALHWLHPLIDYKSPVSEEKKVIAALTQAVNEIIGHFYRSGRWLEVARSYEGELEPFRGKLDTESLLAVSDAYYHLNLPKNSVEMLMWIMNTRNPSKQSESVTVKLASAYGALKDHFRLDMVVKYYLSRFSNSPHKWKVLLLNIQSLLQQDRIDEADRRVGLLLEKVPSGDPRAEVELLLAELRTRQNRLEDASGHFVHVLESELPMDVEIQRVGTMLMSPCMQSCSLDKAKKLLEVASDWKRGELVDEAVRFFAKMRDVSSENSRPVSETESKEQENPKRTIREKRHDQLWEDLLELAPELPELKELAEKKRNENVAD